MALVKNPFFGTSARGTVGNSLSFRTNKSGTIAEVKPHPSNPRTPAQVTQRNAFRALQAFWSECGAIPDCRAAWQLQMTRNRKRYTAYSEFLSAFLSTWQPGGGFGTTYVANFSTYFYTDNPSPTPGQEYILNFKADQYFYSNVVGNVLWNFYDAKGQLFFSLPYGLPNFGGWYVVSTGLLQLPYGGGDAYFVGSPYQPGAMNFHTGVLFFKNVPYIP